MTDSTGEHEGYDGNAWQQIDDGGEVPAYHPLEIKLQIDNINPATE